MIARCAASCTQFNVDYIVVYVLTNSVYAVRMLDAVAICIDIVYVVRYLLSTYAF